MPVQFAGLVAEHQAVRQHAGLFDVSHMGELIVEGPEALAALQHVVTNDLGKLTDGKALYTVMCVESGGVVDDLIVYRESTTRYFLCVNASRRDADREHIRRLITRFRCKLSDVSQDYAQIALQGPQADAILAKLTSHPVAPMAPFTWADTTVAGLDKVRVARTGYTGEKGFELYCAPAQAEPLWRALEEAGGPLGLVPCGLGARDTLRLEMKYPLYGNDIDLDHTPLEAGLGWVVKLAKGDFVGQAALAAQKEKGVARKWVGFKAVERGIPRQGYPIAVGGKEVGTVSSGTHSPTLGYGIGCGYVPAEHAAVGSRLDIIIREKTVAAEVVATPFLKRDKA